MLDPGLTTNDLALRRERIGTSTSKDWQIDIKGLADHRKRMGRLLSGKCLFHQVSWVVLQYFFAQGGHRDVGVDFGGADRLVTEQGLDDAQVGSAFEQGGGEGMAQGMR